MLTGADIEISEELSILDDTEEIVLSAVKIAE